MRFRKRSPTPSRRQRQLSEPTATPAAYSYHSRRDERESGSNRGEVQDIPAVRRRQKTGFWSGITARAATLIVIVVGALLLWQSTQPAVQVLGGNSLLVPPSRTSDYAATATKALSNSPLNHIKPFAHTKTVGAALQAKYPEIGATTVTAPFFGSKPIVYIEPAKPILVLAATNGSFVLDTTGKVVAGSDAAARLPTDTAPVLTDQSNYKAELNHYGLSSKNVSFIRTVIAQLKAKQIKFTSLTLPASASELDVHIADQPYYVKFNLQSGTAREQVGTFLATQQELTRQHITPGQYIDARVEGRAYYQ